MIIVAAPADWRKTSGAVHRYSRISVANFEMDARYSIISCTFQEIAEQSAADAAAMVGGSNCQEQELCFVGDRPEQGKADRLVATRLEREHQEDAAHR